MLPYRDSRISRTILGIFFLIVFGYAIFELRGILRGPVISITSQRPRVEELFMTVTGTATRISSLTMNGEAVSVTEAGAFAEPYLLAPGLNLIVLEARDKYGRRTRTIDRIVYTPGPNISISTTAATSTASTTVAN